MIRRAQDRIDLAFVRIGDPIVGPGPRTALGVTVENLGAVVARNVTIALADPGEPGSAGIVMHHLGDLAPGEVRSAELVLGYAITDSLRLGSLALAVFPRNHAIEREVSQPRSRLRQTEAT